MMTEQSIWIAGSRAEPYPPGDRWCIVTYATNGTKTWVQNRYGPDLFRDEAEAIIAAMPDTFGPLLEGQSDGSD